jgi:hypothetical protein
MKTRRLLLNRRGSETFDVVSAGLKFTATVSRFDDGRLAEIFLNNHKAGSYADTNACDAAVVTSLALQYGAPVDVIRNALKRNADGTAAGPLGAALDRIQTMEKNR